MSNNNLSDHNFRGAVQMIPEVLQYQMKATNGKILHRFMKQQFYVRMMCWSFHNDFLVEVFDEKSQQLFEGGFLEHFDRENRENINLKRYKHLNYDEPKVLTMEHLKAGFVVWLVTIPLAIISFIVEWTSQLFQYFTFKHFFKAHKVKA